MAKPDKTFEVEAVEMLSRRRRFHVVAPNAIAARYAVRLYLESLEVGTARIPGVQPTYTPASRHDSVSVESVHVLTPEEAEAQINRTPIQGRNARVVLPPSADIDPETVIDPRPRRAVVDSPQA